MLSSFVYLECHPRRIVSPSPRDLWTAFTATLSEGLRVRLLLLLYFPKLPTFDSQPPLSLSLLAATLMCLPASVVANKRLVPWLSSLDATLTKNKGVGSADARMPGISDVTTFRHLDVLSPIAAERPWCNNERRHENSSSSGETTPLLPVSNYTERTSGTARPWFPLQVVPGSIVLKLDRTAGWPVFQQRAGKAGSVRLG